MRRSLDKCIANKTAVAHSIKQYRTTMSYNRGRLTRSQSDKMVAGVLSGLARHYGLDLKWLRIGVVAASCITFGAVFLGYIAAMIIIPN